MARFEFDPQGSRVSIEARSSVGPILWAAAGVRGHLEAELKDGELVPGEHPSGHLELDVSDLRSGNPLYDSELQRRVNARRFPTITGDLRFIAAAEGDGRYRLVGDLSFRGVTREVEGTVTAEVVDGRRAVIEGQHEFDIRDYDLIPPKVLGMQIHPQFTVIVHLEAGTTEGR